MRWARLGKVALGVGLSSVFGMEAAWLASSALSYLRYPAEPRAARGPATPLDAFIPAPEIEDRHGVHVDAPATVTMATATTAELHGFPPVRALLGKRGPFVDVLRSIGWEELASESGRWAVFGTVTKASRREPAFVRLSAAEFTSFDEPGFVKIAWSISAEPEGDGARLSIETRIATTSPEARRRFRRYWATVSPGIVVLRVLALRTIKRAAEHADRSERHRA